MSAPDILTPKISHGFDHLDVDGDGDLTEQDHVLMGRRAAEALGRAPGSPGEHEVVEAYRQIWRDLRLPNLPAGVTAISKQQFVDSTRTLADDRDAALVVVGEVAAAFFAVVDADHDGEVSTREYFAFLRAHYPDMTEADADEAFAHLDLDGDGRLSAQEFTQATIEYWSSNDPDAPGNWWIGRPVYQR